MEQLLRMTQRAHKFFLSSSSWSCPVEVGIHVPSRVWSPWSSIVNIVLPVHFDVITHFFAQAFGQVIFLREGLYHAQPPTLEMGVLLSGQTLMDLTEGWTLVWILQFDKKKNFKRSYSSNFKCSSVLFRV